MNHDAGHGRIAVGCASGITPEDAQGFERVVCSIRCVVGESRGRWQSQVPDVDNVPRPIVDAFTGLLCPDGAFHPSRGVQVEAHWGPGDRERAEVWIYGRLTGPA